MKQKISIIKVGGNVIDDASNFQAFLELYASISGLKILIHGGGKLATEMAAQLGIPQQMVDGRRITDGDTLKVVTMVYAGFINKNIVGKLQGLQTNAIGLSGVDGALIKAEKRKHVAIDYGFVGDVKSVNTALLNQLLAGGFCPVIAPITADENGQLLNTNADTIAQEIAQALVADFDVQLIYCFEKRGVLKDVDDESSLITHINSAVFQQLTDEKIIFAGMLPKLHNAFVALEKGVSEVVIGKWSEIIALTKGLDGTSISNK